MIGEFLGGCLVLFLIFGPYLIDAYAEHRRAVRKARNLRRREVSEHRLPRSLGSLPSSEVPVHSSRDLGGTARGPRTRRPDARPAPLSRSRWL